MSKNYDMIATVDIDLASPIVDEASFGSLLIVGPLPKVAPNKAPPAVGAYASIEEVEAAGWSIAGKNADPVGVAAMVAFGQSPRPTAIYIAPIQKVNGEPAAEGKEATEPTNEAVVETVKRAVSYDGWYVVCPAGVDESEYEDIATFIEGQEKMFCFTEMNCFPELGEERGEGEELCIPTVSKSYYRTMWVYGRESSAQAMEDVHEANRYMNVAWTAKWLQYESGSETAAFKILTSVNPSALSVAEMNAITAKNGNFFTTVGNRNLTMNGMVAAGEWADVIRFRDWQKNDMQVAVVNLFVARPKVPYTDAGIALIQNQMIASLKRGQDRGGIAETEFDEFGNSIPGYVTSVPLASEIPGTEKASRKLHEVKFKARLSGAIHFAELKGSLTYEL